MRNHVHFAVGLAFAAGLCAALAASSQAQVIVKLAGRMPEKYLELYRQAADDAPETAALAEKGLALFDARKFDEAIAPLKQAYEHGANSAPVLFAYGSILARQGKTAEALDALGKVEAAAQDRPELGIACVRSMEILAQLNAGMGDWKRAEELFQQKSDLAQKVGGTDDDDRRLTEHNSLEFAQQLLKESADHPRGGRPARGAAFLIVRGWNMAELNQEGQAQKMLAEALQLGADHPEVHGLYGYACCAAAAWDEAEKHLRIAETGLAGRNPPHQVYCLACMKLAEMALRKQDAAEALAYYRRAVSGAEDLYIFTRSFNLYAWKIRDEIKRLEPIAAAQKEAARITPAASATDTPEALQAAARTFLAANQGAKAAEFSARAVRLKPEDPSVLASHVEILNAAKDYLAVETVVSGAAKMAFEKKDTDSLVRILDAYSLALAEDVTTSAAGVPVRIKELGADKLIEQYMKAVPDEPRLAISYLRVIREALGYIAPTVRAGDLLRSHQETLRIAPHALDAAWKQERWETVCRLGQVLQQTVHSVVRNTSAKKIDNLRQVSKDDLSNLFEKVLNAAVTLKRSEYIKVAYLGLLYVDLGYDDALKLRKEDEPDVAAMERTMQRFEKYAKSGLLTKDNRDQAEFYAVYALVNAGSRPLFDKAIEIARLHKLGSGDPELYVAQRLPQDRNAPYAPWVAEILARKYRVEQAAPFSAEDYYTANLSAVRADKAAVAQAADDAAKRALLAGKVRQDFDFYLTFCLTTDRLQEAVEGAEWLHGWAMRDLLGARLAEAGAGTSPGAPETSQAAVAHGPASAVALLAPQAASQQRDLKLDAGPLSSATASQRFDLEVQSTRNIIPLALGDMQQMLAPDEALLICHLGGGLGYPARQGFVALLTPKEFHVHFSPALIVEGGRSWKAEDVAGRGFGEKIIASGTGEKIVGIGEKCKNLLAALRAAAGTGLTPPAAERLHESARDLYASLIAPLEPYLKCRRLIVVPSDDLYGIPFGLLEDGQGRRLAERFAISYSPSATVLKFCLAKHGTLGDKVLVMANPALPDPAYQLKYAEEEATAVKSAFPGATCLTGVEATETAFRSRAAGCSVLHFACHAMLDSKNPLATWLALARDDANDGQLSVSDIMGLRVDAQLVVLSACDTGRGDVSASRQEVIGLTRAWMFAGAPTVVASLWKLDDRSTSELMGEFYCNLKTMGRAEALQQAQLVMMKKYENPYYWGAFVLYGDYR